MKTFEDMRTKTFGELKVGEVFSLKKPFDPEDYWVKRSSRTADMHWKPYPPCWYYFSKKELVYTPIVAEGGKGGRP